MAESRRRGETSLNWLSFGAAISSAIRWIEVETWRRKVSWELWVVVDGSQG